jgi:hypothetical protein
VSQPKTLDEHSAKYKANHKITGSGPDAIIHMPCPFCAEPNFAVGTALQIEAAFADGAICKSCGRGMRVVRDKPGLIPMFFLTCGDDPPKYLKQTFHRMPE